MHEVGLMQDLLNTAIERAIQNNASQIDRIAIRLGEAAGITPESLELAFEVVKQGTIADRATLDLDYIPTVCYCSTCQEEFHPQDPLQECPTCHQPYAEIRSGKEFELSSLDLS